MHKLLPVKQQGLKTHGIQSNDFWKQKQKQLTDYYQALNTFKNLLGTD